MIEQIVFVSSSTINGVAFDSDTRQGWLVDRMIRRLNIKCVKSILFDVDRSVPRKDRKHQFPDEAFSLWKNLYGDEEYTLAVTFGKTPKRIFNEFWKGAWVHLDYVGQLPSDEKMTKYVDECVEKILLKLKELEG